MLEKIKEYLGYDDSGFIEFIKVKDDHYEIKYGQEYRPPKLNFGNLIRLSEFLGTENITHDKYDRQGYCDTCDIGSEYGHEITIRYVTKNKEEFEKLMGTKYGKR